MTANISASNAHLIPIGTVKHPFTKPWLVRNTLPHPVGPDPPLAVPHPYLLLSIQGKRSISDHIYETANYIRCLQNNIRELRNKRDKLNKFSCWNDLIIENGSSSKFSPVNVTVKSCIAGIEVSITGDFPMEGFPLSRVLEILLDEGLNVIICICTKVEGSSHYTIPI
ncbi:transcription factor bHLH [Forsythia ovata]|uniref:Transcription factor bHLH n=1 Tax=Forsythia ovata TaxID=205694 RepID=A0ABD1X9B9_9LAMI